MKKMLLVLLVLAACAVEQDGVPRCFEGSIWNAEAQVCEEFVPADSVLILVSTDGDACSRGSTPTADGCFVQHCREGSVVFFGRCTKIGQRVKNRGETCYVTADGGCAS